MNSSWSCKETEFDGVYYISPFCAGDIRGFFLKDYSEDIFASMGIPYNIKESFYSFSTAGVIRGMHFQREKQMAKLVRCVSGKIFDVVCDLRKNSPNFGKWISFILSADNMSELLIPGGFAHGFLALEDSLVTYKCSECFSQPLDDGIVWNDPDLSIDWPFECVNSAAECPIVSEKDCNLQSLKSFVEKYGGLK